MEPEREETNAAGAASAGSETNETPDAAATGGPETEATREAASSTPPARGGSGETASAPDDDEPGGEVDHTPIIITGGSTAIEFDRDRYDRVGTTNRVISRNPLRIRSLAFVPNIADPTSRHFCFMPRLGMRYEIVLTCQRATQPDERIIIRGGQGLTTHELEFSHTEFVTDGFPPETEHGIKRGNADRRITGLTVIEIPPVGDVVTVHTCTLIPASGRCRFVIDDRA